jgi:hypothetical protein
MAFCKKCGTQLDDDAQFCHSCGTAVKDTTKSQSAAPTPDDGFRTMRMEAPVYGVVNLENLPSGHVIDNRYEIKRKLGQGGFGAVYLAHDRRLEVEKAIKVIPEMLKNDIMAMDNLRREAQTMLGLNHPNIVRMYDLHEDKVIAFIDMEFVAGKNLSEYRLEKPQRKLSEDEVRRIAIQKSMDTYGVKR